MDTAIGLHGQLGRESIPVARSLSTDGDMVGPNGWLGDMGFTFVWPINGMEVVVTPATSATVTTAFEAAIFDAGKCVGTGLHQTGTARVIGVEEGSVPREIAAYPLDGEMEMIR